MTNASLSTGGIIATSDPRASAAGADVLREGGNAVDAAVTAALALLVLEPHACGIGGDAFLLLQRPGHPPEALDGSGAVPAALAADGERQDYEPVPPTGPRTFTVPGALDLFEATLATHGTIDLWRATGPARRLAAEGFEVRPTLAASARKLAPLIRDDPVLGPLYVPGGHPVRSGDMVRNPRLAAALELVATSGARELYEGALADAVATRSHEVGGHLDAADLAAHRTISVAPASTPFRGTDVWELPPPTQGQAVLTALEVLEAGGRFDVDAVMEAITEGLLRTGVDLRAGSSAPTGRGDTTYVAAVDRLGCGVSLITSIFSEFGSCIGVDALGGPLQNRAHGITNTGRRPRPGKPPHTTIPALVTTDGKLSHVLGVVGGYMQAQGQVQVLVNLLVHGMAPQAAVDAPRFRLLHNGSLALEPGHELVARDAAALDRDPGNGGFGGCQLVAVGAGGVLGASDPRRGGAVVEVPGS